MDYSLILIIIHFTFTIISVILSINEAHKGYSVKDLILDILLSMIPIINIVYPISVFYKKYMVDTINKIKRLIGNKSKIFLNKPIK